MPEISRFYGIIIYMFYNEHQPAHFHAKYGEYEAVIGIDSLAILRGQLPGRALGLVMEWASIHQSDLKKDWEMALKQKPLEKINPLK
ncbi:MAG: DUF4160 domain-containing protein [Deltaproteobacteria bacterium]|nr:DUF4160 domain-containing protein [Deltaproteobacteria bacterium]